MTSQLIVGASNSCAVVVWEKTTKNAGTENVRLAVWLDNKNPSRMSAVGYVGTVVGAQSNLRTGASVTVPSEAVGQIDANALLAYLPSNVTVTVGKKWTLPKAGKIRAKGGVVDSSMAGENPSGLKLSYATKTGLFKGSFKVYELNGTKFKAQSATVNGAVVDGKGYGSAVIKKKGSVAVEIR